MASKGSVPLLHAIMDRLPLRPINCSTFVVTKIIASDIYHPLHIATKRKMAAFDPQGFYWRVNCPNEISRKAIVRNECKKDFKNAFIWALAEAGWGKDGMPLNLEKKQGRLTGAVLLMIAKDPERVLKADKADLRKEAGNVVKKLLARQDHQKWKSRPRHFEENEKVEGTARVH